MSEDAAPHNSPSEVFAPCEDSGAAYLVSPRHWQPEEFAFDATTMVRSQASAAAGTSPDATAQACLRSALRC